MLKERLGKRKKREERKENFVKERRGKLIVYLVLVGIVIGVLVRQFMMNHYEHCFTCLLTLFLFMIPSFVERRLKISVPNTLEVLILLFIFSAEILGEIGAFYLKLHWWDAMLHVINGFLMAAIGISMVDILNRSEVFKFQLSPLFVSLVAFCFSMTIGVLWEFFEYAMDMIVQTDMQKDTLIQAFSSVELHPGYENTPVVVEGIEEVVFSGKNMTVDGALQSSYTLGLGGYLDIGLMDTMQDLFVNFVGAIVFSVVGFFYIKNRGRGGWLKRLILRRKREE